MGFVSSVKLDFSIRTSGTEQGNAKASPIVNSAVMPGAATCDGDPPTAKPAVCPAAIFGLAVSYPASSPEVTGVGGTMSLWANIPIPTGARQWHQPGNGCFLYPRIVGTMTAKLACSPPPTFQIILHRGAYRAGTDQLATDSAGRFLDFQRRRRREQFVAVNSEQCLHRRIRWAFMADGLRFPIRQRPVYVPDVSLLASAEFPRVHLLHRAKSNWSGRQAPPVDAQRDLRFDRHYRIHCWAALLLGAAFAGIVTLLNQAVNRSERTRQ